MANNGLIKEWKGFSKKARKKNVLVHLRVWKEEDKAFVNLWWICKRKKFQVASESILEIIQSSLEKKDEKDN